MSKNYNFHPIFEGAAIEDSHVSILGLIRNPDPDRPVSVSTLNTVTGALDTCISDIRLPHEGPETIRFKAPKNSRSLQYASDPGILAYTLIEDTNSIACIAAAPQLHVRSQCGPYLQEARSTVVDDDRASNWGVSQ